jgi:hypothetical protein
MNSRQPRSHQSNGSSALHSFRQKWGMLALTCLTTGCLAFTFFFACNISAEQPVATNLIFDQPNNSVLALNILSQISMFLLYELTTALLEAIRWTITCTESGSSAFTFLILSRATNIIGVFSLLMSKGTTPGTIQKDGHRLWGIQRYITCRTANVRLFFVFLRGALAVLLLSNISFTTTQHVVHQFPIARAGLSPLNTSLTLTDQFNATATAQFWWYFPAILSDSLAVQPATPLNCSGDQCQSYFFPGSMRNILLDPKLPPIGSNEFPGAISYLQNDAPGYQIDYSPVDPTDPPLSLTDCRVYGIEIMAIQICLKKSNNSLLAGIISVYASNVGWSACPDATAETSGCLNTTDWRSDIPLQTKMTISERRATTIFNRFNFTILDVVKMSDPTPVVYSPDDFFPFYEIIFAIDESQPNWFATTQMLFLTSLTSYLRYDADTESATGSVNRVSRLQQFMAVPMAVFNDVIYGVGLPADMGNTASLAIPSYRVNTCLTKLMLANYRSVYTVLVHGGRIRCLDLVLSRLVCVVVDTNS